MRIHPTSMLVRIHGHTHEIGVDRYSIAFAAGRFAGHLASGVSEAHQTTVFERRRVHLIHRFTRQFRSGRGVIYRVW